MPARNRKHFRSSNGSGFSYPGEKFRLNFNVPPLPAAPPETGEVPMGLLTTCPKCGATIARGATCPSCFHGEQAGAPRQVSIMEEYAQRQAVHKRNYTIFMVSALSLGLTTILLIVAVFMVTKGRRVAYAVTPGQELPALDMEQPDPGNFGEPEDSGLPPDSRFPEDEPPGGPFNPSDAMEAMQEQEEEEFPELTADDIDLTYLTFWLVIIGGLTIAEGSLTYLVFKARSWWPIELNCPSCDVRLDELGGDPERCPSCTVKLR
jgi:hypothetical protein